MEQTRIPTASVSTEDGEPRSNGSAAPGRSEDSSSIGELAFPAKKAQPSVGFVLDSAKRQDRPIDAVAIAGGDGREETFEQSAVYLEQRLDRVEFGFELPGGGPGGLASDGGQRLHRLLRVSVNIVREIVEFATPEIENAGCSVALHVATSLPPALFDEAQLRQALLNLLRNAREAMPGGGPIEVSVSAEGMSVVLTVDDQGIGVPEEIRARVFDPFFS